MSAHAFLSASSAHRWLHCPIAPSLEAKFPDTLSPYAAEGTLAHKFCELKLRKYAVEPMASSTYTRRLHKLQKETGYQKEMDECSEEYLDRIKSIMLSYPNLPHVVAEQKVDFSKYVPDGFGTADCLILGGDTLNIVDYKHGKGVEVDAKNNPQLRLYALGALERYAILYPLKQVTMTIIQPRINNYSTDSIAVAELRDWGTNVVKPAADKAMKGEGEAQPGEWCRFCRARQQCKARADYYKNVGLKTQEAGDPKLLKPSSLSQYLELAKGLKQWIEDLQDYALTSALNGAEIPGWKAVEGRGSRGWTDQEKAFEVLLQHGIPESILYNRVPLTLAQTEKAVGKKEFEEWMQDFIVKNPGKPTLVPDSDKRPAISNVAKAENVFKDMEA